MNNNERINITNFRMEDWLREYAKHHLAEEVKEIERLRDRNLFRTYNRGKNPTK